MAKKMRAVQVIAMTVIGLKEGRIYFKAHAATEATAANGLVHLTS
jgi:hypothetical protein